MSQNPSYSHLVCALTDILELANQIPLSTAEIDMTGVMSTEEMETFIGSVRDKASKALEPEPLIQDIDPSRKERDPLDYRHIDEFLDDPMIQFKHPELRYVNFFLSHHRKAASEKLMHAPFMDQFQLFADYEGKTYQVTGASRLGDIFLAESFQKDAQYSTRVAPDFRKFANWRDKADWQLSVDERLALVKAAGFSGEPKRGQSATKYLENWMASNKIPVWYSDTTAEQRTALRDAKRAAAEEARRQREETNSRAP